MPALPGDLDQQLAVTDGGALTARVGDNDRLGADYTNRLARQLRLGEIVPPT